MANFENLRAAINQAITDNGVGAITGLLLNSVLQAMVTALGNGYQFVGIATPSTNPGNPDQNVFYLAYEGGTYVNFGQLQVTRGFNIIKRDNVTWSVEQLTSVDDELTANGQNPVTSGAAFGVGANIAYYDLTLSPAVYPSNVAAQVVAKTITIAGFKLMSGGCIRIKFPYDNTAFEPTLNISGTGAKPLYYNGKRINAANTWKANEVVEFYYDGTNWQGKKAVEVFKTINSQSLLGEGNININDFYYLEFGEDAEEAINVLSRTNRQVVCIYTILTPTLQEISIKMFAHSFNASTGKIDFSGVVGNTLYYCSVTNAIQWSEVQTLDLTAEEQETYRMTYGSTGNIWNEVNAFAAGKFVTVVPNIPDANFDIPVCIAFKRKSAGLTNPVLYFMGISFENDIERYIEVSVEYSTNYSQQIFNVIRWDVSTTILTNREIYDVTYYNGDTFGSLAELLGSAYIDEYIPIALRKGGMTIKFVLTSNNKYVEYRLLTQTFSTDVNDWEIVGNVSKEELATVLIDTVAESGVYDVTANNDNAKFASLSALLNDENLDTLIPLAKRKGGMSIKFVLSSDNKYVQYRLMADSFSTNEADWQGVDNVPTANSKNLVTSGGVYDALLGEYVVATATSNTGSVATAMVGIYDVNDVLIVEGEGEVTARILYGKTYKVKCSRVYDYLTPAEQTFTASVPSRQVTMQYTYIERDVVTLDQTISDSAQMLSGDIQGDVIKEIRSHSHLYLGTPATQSGDTEGTELICQLDDEDSTKYFDGTPAALDGSEGDQWLKLPVFWWKVVGVGEVAADGAHNLYNFMYAFVGEPDPSWNKWQGDRNLVAAKEMKVVNNKGRSVSGGQSTGNFTQAQGNAYAAARNLGCQQVTWEWQWMMCMLCYAWNGETNSQKTNGIGSNSYTRTLGVTDRLGMTDTTPAQATSLTSARFWGLEAWWNCKNEWMGNVVMENYVLSITDQNTKQTRQVSGFIQCGGTGGWNSRMRIDANGDFVPLAKAGTETTYYCDWVNSNSGSRVLVRSNNNASADGGVACVSASVAPSVSYASVGSRLAFNGVITEAESVAAYKAALA